MAKSCGPMEKSETPKQEARAHSSSFLRKAVVAKGGKAPRFAAGKGKA